MATDNSGTKKEGTPDIFSVSSLAASDPDLQMLTASAPSCARVGDLIDVSWTVKNVGTSSAAAEWTDYVFLSTNATYDGGNDIYIAEFSASNSKPLAAGASYILTRSISIQSTGKEGVNYLIVLTNI